MPRNRPTQLYWRLFASHASLAMGGAAVATGVFLIGAGGGKVAAALPYLIALGTLFGLLLTAGITLLVTRRVHHTIDHVAGALDQIGVTSAANINVTEVLDDDAEEVGRALNRLSGRLAERIEKLEEDRQQLRTILSGMVEGVVALDADQRILYANDRAADLLELPPHSPVGRRLWEVVRQRRLLDVVGQAIAQPEPTRDEIDWNGATRRLTVHAARLPGAPPRGAVLVVHDTTELRRLERLREDFVANVSHELKTPLSVIRVCVETLLDGAVNDPEHRGPFLERIAQQSDRLHSLILDLLSLGRIESGNALVDFQSVPVAPLVADCLERFRARAEARRQKLVITNTEQNDLSPAVWGDKEAIDQILDNLVDNALKYTAEEGLIRVSWRVEGEVIKLEVSDTGIGIPESDLPRIFERFYRVDKARSREVGGTGLGLSIVKHLVQSMHGNISATSKIGQGTSFVVSLPRAREA